MHRLLWTPSPSPQKRKTARESRPPAWHPRAVMVLLVGVVLAAVLCGADATSTTPLNASATIADLQAAMAEQEARFKALESSNDRVWMLTSAFTILQMQVSVGDSPTVASLDFAIASPHSLIPRAQAGFAMLEVRQAGRCCGCHPRAGRRMARLVEHRGRPS